MPNLDFKNPAVQKTALSVVLGGALVGIFFFTHFVPFGYPVQQEKLNALKADYERKSTELARARTTVADLPRFEAEYKQLHEQWSLAAELLPADQDMPALLRKITLAGEQTGVSFVLFKPAVTHAETYYTEMPVEIGVTGGYHQVGSFLAELANLRRIVTVSSVHLKTANTSDPNNTTSAEFTASAYSLNSSPAPASASPAKAPVARTTPKGAPHARKSS